MLLLLLLYYHRARLYILRQNYFSYLFDSSHAFIHHTRNHLLNLNVQFLGIEIKHLLNVDLEKGFERHKSYHT